MTNVGLCQWNEVLTRFTHMDGVICVVLFLPKLKH